MSRENKFFKNTLAISLAHGLQPFLSLVLSLAIARLLGKESFGVYATIFYLIAIFEMISSLGVKTVLTREVAKDKSSASNYITSSVIVTFALSILAIILLHITVRSIKYDDIILQPVYILAWSLIASGIADSLEGILQGLEKIQAIASAWMIEQILRVAVSLFIIYNGYGIIELALVYAVIRYVYPVLLYWMLMRTTKKIRWQPDLNLVKKLFSATRVFGPIMIFVSVYWRIDSIILAKVLDLKDVGIYNAGNKLFWFFIILVRSFFASFYPLVSDIFANRASRFEIVCKKSIFYLLALLVPIAVSITLFSEQIITTLWGQQYIGAGTVLQILIWCTLPYAVSKVFAYAFISSNLQRFDLWVNIIGVAFKVTIFTIMINLYGVVGGAWANLIGMFFVVVIQLPFVMNYLFKFELSSMLMPCVKLLIAVFSMFVIGKLFPHVNFILMGVVINVIYFATLFLIKVFNDEDKLLFRKLLHLSRT